MFRLLLEGPDRTVGPGLALDGTGSAVTAGGP